MSPDELRLLADKVLAILELRADILPLNNQDIADAILKAAKDLMTP